MGGTWSSKQAQKLREEPEKRRSERSDLTVTVWMNSENSFDLLTRICAWSKYVPGDDQPLIDWTTLLKHGVSHGAGEAIIQQLRLGLIGVDDPILLVSQPILLTCRTGKSETLVMGNYSLN